VTKIQPYISRKYRCPIVELPCDEDIPASYSIPKQPEKNKTIKEKRKKKKTYVKSYTCKGFDLCAITF
jgi:hypothetical protein